MAYTDSITAPRTLSAQEIAALLSATGEHRSGFRDHVLFSVALGTGLREHEILALNWQDVCTEAGARRVVRLHTYKRSNDNPEAQEVHLSNGLRRKLERLRKNARRDGLPAGPEDPVFLSQRRRRLSDRMVREAFKVWQERAGFDRRFTFHALRHTAITRAYKAGGNDIRLAQRFARHASVTSTERYTHPSDEDLAAVVDRIAC